MSSSTRRLSSPAQTAPAAPVKRSVPPWHVWLAMAALALVTILALHRSLDVPFYLDDNAKIVNNLDIRSLRDLPRTLVYPYDKDNFNFKRNDPSRPLVYLTFALNYHVGKDNPRGYHVVNLLLHIVNALLLFLLLRMVAVRVFRHESVIAPLFGALIFALHPVNAGTVCYVFCRSDLLATVFILAALLLFQVRGRWALAAYPLSLVAFALALASKQSAIVLPALAFCLVYLFHGDGWRAELKARRWQHVGLWAIAIIYLLMRATWFAGIGDMEAEKPWARDAYLLTQPLALLRYLQLLIVPIGLAFNHCLVQPKSFFEPRVIVPLIVLAGMAIPTIRLARRNTPITRAVVVFVLWMLIALAPTSSFFPTTSALVENRLYLPSLALAMLAMMLYVGLCTTETRRRCAQGAALLLIVLFGIGSLYRCNLYRTPQSLWEEVIRQYPLYSLGNFQLGVEAMQRQDIVEAERLYKLAIKVDPEDANAHSNLGMVYLNTKRTDLAVQEIEAAIAIDPDHEEAQYNLGAAYELLGQPEKALPAYEKAAALNPDRLQSREKLALLYLQQGNLKDAERATLDVLRLVPDHFDALSNLGFIYWQQRRYEDVERTLNRTLSLDPACVQAYQNLILLYTQTGNTAKRQWAEEKLKALEAQP